LLKEWIKEERVRKDKDIKIREKISRADRKGGEKASREKVRKSEQGRKEKREKSNRIIA